MSLVIDKGPHLPVAIIVQARMGATRLPGKPLLPVLDRPLLFYLIERLKNVKTPSRLIIATTVRKEDDLIAEFVMSQGVECFRGEEDNVLSRYMHAAKDAKVIVRITADCPLIDPTLVDEMLSQFTSIDYLSNTLKRSYPRGQDIEIFTKSALEKAYNEAILPEEKEHVTLYMVRHPEKFNLKNFQGNQDASFHRWTVDTKEDFELIKRIIEALYPKNSKFSWQDVMELLKLHPAWIKINAHIEQKKV